MRLPNPEAHKKFVVSFCNKGDVRVRFIPGLRVPFASIDRSNGSAMVCLKEPLIGDLLDSTWDWDAYHETSHLLPELRFTYTVLKRFNTGLQKTVSNILCDNMCERARHGSYKGRDKAMYLGRYEFTMNNRGTIMNREHPSVSALYVIDFRERNLWQGFFPELDGMPGAAFYVPKLEALGLEKRIPEIMEAQSEDKFYELVMEIVEISKEQPQPKQEDKQDAGTDTMDDDSEPDNADGDSDGADDAADDSDGGDDNESSDQEEGEEDKGEGEEDDDSSDGDRGDSGATEESEGSGSEGAEDGDEQDSRDPAEGGESGDVDGEEGDQDADNTGDSDGSSGGYEDDGDNEESTDSKTPASGDGTGSEASWDDVNDDTLDLADTERAMTAPGEDALELKQGDRYRPIGKFNLVKLDSGMAQGYMKGEIEKHTSTTSMTRSIQKYLKCMTADSYEYGLERGRLHAKHLPRIFSQKHKPKIFKQKQHHILRTDTAVTLLVDCSSSMGTERYAIACASSLIVSDTLRDLSIQYEILGFTEEGRGIDIFEFKAYHEALSHEHILLRMSSSLVDKNYTPDAESVLYAAGRLNDRSEQNKVLMVLCDGQPMGSFGGCGKWYLTQVCDFIQKNTEINLIGIGIKHEGVKNYYENHIIVHDIKEDLEPRMIEALSKMLLS